MPAQTVLTAAMRAESYVDLPKPIPDAVALLPSGLITSS
ncbi:hypothetical protein MetexDRAFT_1154 [Methylorubrum extorquens DSM 13060]|uniref:Uncharacterized protein n=1 Tax=Methylorubrum extorquens DSM 13060 TaxID=882800 RepID=H1KEU2_METEX|nr:hypothetical protein MetexDRAFT_1154 [Methylorubrum extorquens DSM 13060]